MQVERKDFLRLKSIWYCKYLAIYPNTRVLKNRGQKIRVVGVESKQQKTGILFRHCTIASKSFVLSYSQNALIWQDVTKYSVLWCGRWAVESLGGCGLLDNGCFNNLLLRRTSAWKLGANLLLRLVFCIKCLLWSNLSTELLWHYFDLELSFCLWDGLVMTIVNVIHSGLCNTHSTWNLNWPKNPKNPMLHYIRWWLCYVYLNLHMPELACDPETVPPGAKPLFAKSSQLTTLR